MTQTKSKLELRGLFLMVIAGGIAGVGLNVAFGSFAWNFEGILGGLLSGLFIYVMS